MRWIRGRFQYGFGILLNAYGPANGGFVFVLNICAGPISVFFMVVIIEPSLICLSYGDIVVDIEAEIICHGFFFFLCTYSDILQIIILLFLIKKIWRILSNSYKYIINN